MQNIYGYIVSTIYIGLVFLLAKFLGKFGKEASRKCVHILLANWWIIAMIFFTTPVYAAIMPAVFIIVNYLSHKFKIIKMIEREKGEDDSLGTVYYAISLTILALLTFGPMKEPLIGLAGIFTMGYGDGLAAIIGKKVKSYKYEISNSIKSVAGSLTMFIISLLINGLILMFLGASYWLIKAIIIAIIATFTEAVSAKGTDNITVPLLISGLVYLFI